MLQEIKNIIFCGVNCYLITLDTGFVLVDTSFSKNRLEVEEELKGVGYKPKTLKLIMLTHGDFDHTGNCTYLREKYDTKIAMHNGDKGMVEKGDLFYNMNVNFLIRILGEICCFSQGAA